MARSRKDMFLVGLLVTAVMFAVLASGCSAKKSAVEVTEADGGTTQQLVVGQELRVSLKANPTTGYVWEVDGAVPGQLEQVGEPEFSADSSAMGAGGMQVWTFVAKQQGTAPLKLKYWRSFEPTVPPVETFSLEVEVR